MVHGLVPDAWIEDRTRRFYNFTGYTTVAEGALAVLEHVTLDPWRGRWPLVFVESEASGAVIEPIVQEYRGQMAVGRGQAGRAYFHNVVAPQLYDGQAGLRPGELLGLQWGDLDEASRQIHVRRTVWRGTFYVPKTKQSRRKVDIGDQLLGVLSRWRRDHYGEATPLPDAVVFPGADGGPLDLDAVRKRAWVPALAKAGLRHVRIYSLRHTFASMLIRQGENGIRGKTSEIARAGSIPTASTIP
jgi:hypothetical protein